MDTLNLFTYGYISHFSYEEINMIFTNYSRYSSKKGNTMRNLTSQIPKSTTPSISRSELGTMLEDMKIEIFHSFAMKMDTM